VHLNSGHGGDDGDGGVACDDVGEVGMTPGDPFPSIECSKKELLKLLKYEDSKQQKGHRKPTLS
jgi:hypothetical protein